MQTASLAVLEYASKYKESLLFNRYMAGRDQIARGRSEGPFAYFVPQEQRDPVAAVELLRRLAFGGVRVSQLTLATTVAGETFPAGTWVVPTDQEFAAMARQVLNVQKYPDMRQYPGGPPMRPYDAAGWTLPLQMGVRVVAATSPLTDEVRANLKLLGPAPDPRRKPTPYNTTDARDAVALRQRARHRLRLEPQRRGHRAPGRARDRFRAGVVGRSRAEQRVPRHQSRLEGRRRERADRHRQLPACATSSAASPKRRRTRLVKTLALVAERTAATGTPLARPRIGLFRPWGSSMDEGWTRWLLEQYGFDLVTLRPVDFRTPLREKVDVVILAEDARIPVEGGGGGRGRGAGPGGGGGRSVRPEYADLVGADDLARFDQFVRTGGTVVCLGGASTFAITQFKLPVKNVIAGLRPEEYFLRGSLVEVTTDPTHPVMAGMPDKAAVFVDGSPVFETLEGFTGRVLATYQETGSPLLSGYLIGEKYLYGKAAALDVQVDQGHVILLGFRPQWRGQPFGTMRVLFNSAMFVRPAAE